MNRAEYYEDQFDRADGFTHRQCSVVRRALKEALDYEVGTRMVEARFADWSVFRFGKRHMPKTSRCIS